MVRRKHLGLIAIFGLINAITITYGESHVNLKCVKNVLNRFWNCIESHRLTWTTICWNFTSPYYL